MRRSFLLTALLITAVAYGQIPSNQSCATAFELPVASGNVQDEFMVVDSKHFQAAAPAPATDCSGTGDRKMGWYYFTATSTKHWVRSEGPELDSQWLDVFSGTCGSLTYMTCMQANTAYAPLTGLTVGETYFIRVIGLITGTEQMGLAIVSDPPHDECVGAVELSVVGGQPQVWPATELSTLGATQSQPACAGDAAASDDDVWYRFTATATSHQFPRVLLHPNDPVVEWFSGSCGALTSVVCDAPRATGLTVGQPYYIRVHSESTDPANTLRMLVDVAESATNDECSGALPLHVTLTGEEPQAVDISTLIGTSSTAPCDTRTSDVWLTFTAPGATVTVVGSTYQDLALFSGSCGSLTCVHQETMNPEVVFTGLTVGQAYFLKVGTNTNFANVSIRAFATPANDECANAMPLDVLTAPGASFSFGSTCGATQSSLACGNGPASDVWYNFTATGTQQLLYIESSVPQSNTKFEVLSGSCGSLASVFCNTFGNINGAGSITGLTAGSPYYLRVYTSLNNVPSAFRIGLTQGVVNDDCPGAIELPVLSIADIPGQPLQYNTNATAGTGSCGTFKDMWYRFTPTTAEGKFLSAYPVISTGLYIELLSGGCDDLTSVSCTSNSSTGNAHQSYTGLVPGNEYHVRISGNVARPFVPLRVATPVNDEITGALAAPSGTAFTQPLWVGDGYGATESYPSFCVANQFTDDDTWFHFTATAATHTVKAVQRNPIFAETPLPNPLAIEVFDTLSTDAAVLEEHAIGCGYGSIALTGLTVGHVYRYRVFTPWHDSEDICAFATWYTNGNNDEASGATPLAYSDDHQLYFNTAGATQSQPGAGCLVDDFADDDIWFSFTANGSPARVVVGYATADITLEVFSGTPGNLTSIACDGNVLVLPPLTSGQTYYLRLYSWKNATPAEGRIGLFTTPSLTANPLVDESCLGPVLLENPSIEQGEYCLASLISIGAIGGMGLPVAPGWPRLQETSSDGYSSCTLFDDTQEMPSTMYGGDEILARSGKGMAGILLKYTGPWREYLSAPLSEPLIPGEPYLVSLHAISANTSLTLNGIGAFLSTGPSVQLSSVAINVEPQVVDLDVVKGGEWTNISAVIVPDGPWDHIAIGCFFQDFDEYTYEGNFDADAYYFIDDVVVAHIQDANCITGIGDVPPLDEDVAASGDALRVYPNPANDRVNIVCGADLFGKRGVIEVFDVTGQRVHADEVPFLNALQLLQLSSDWKEGLYLVMVRVEGHAPKSARLVLRR